MNQILLGLLIGAGSGVIVLPIGMGIFFFIRNTMERRKIKRMLKRGEFLQPIDKKDYDGKIWDQYMDVKKNEECLKNLNKKIFKTEEPTKGRGITGVEIIHVK